MAHLSCETDRGRRQDRMYEVWAVQLARQAQFAAAFTSLAAFSMSAATAFGCDT